MDHLDSEEAHSKKSSIYDFHVTNMTGDEISLKDYKGKVLLIVNTASKCSFAPQLRELEALFKKYKEKGFTVLAFPCNQYMGQEPYDDEVIRTFCTLTYGVSFPMFSKIDVKGEHAHPLFQYLKEEKAGIFGKEIKWNFTKFLIDREGNIIERYAPMVNPEKIKKDIEKVL
ncbi:MAG: glutathione peroxidase [Tissierellia bacterium]|nr:glutathione peroxidase [Tissierellia bacterium]